MDTQFLDNSQLNLQIRRKKGLEKQNAMKFRDLYNI